MAADGLDPATREGGLRYDELIEAPALRPLLHRLRTGGLAVEEVCEVVTNPAKIVEAGA
ncbi:MAG: hypothetical protein HYU66_21345 [Armatimonadetes bacterium]|nr:hypothetical protein [Armatimonadota bacterium]